MRICSRCHVKKPDGEFVAPKTCRKCSEKRKSYSRPDSHYAWFEDNRTHLREYNRQWRLRLKLETVVQYGGACSCGESQPEFLTIDHIEGGGHKHRTLIQHSGGHDFYRWLKNQGYPEGYRVLCFNCNCQRTEAPTDVYLEVLKHYSGGTLVCACCSEARLTCLTIDHVEGRAKGDSKRGKSLAKWLKNNGFPSGFRILCYNCNCGRKLGPCPHQA